MEEMLTSSLRSVWAELCTCDVWIITTTPLHKLVKGVDSTVNVYLLTLRLILGFLRFWQHVFLIETSVFSPVELMRKLWMWQVLLNHKSVLTSGLIIVRCRFPPRCWNTSLTGTNTNWNSVLIQSFQRFWFVSLDSSCQIFHVKLKMQKF